MNDYTKTYEDMKDIDNRILELFEERQAIIQKHDYLNKPLYNFNTMELFKEIMTVSGLRNRRGHAKHWEENFKEYKQALESSRQPIDNPRIVYQGEPGAYSEVAAIDFFGKYVNSKGLYGFEDTFEALKNNEADYAVLPIENSSTGAIRQVYDLMAQYECYIVGETTVSVQHNLMVIPGTTIDQINTVYSHEQGLFQCEEFLNQHRDWNQVPQADTAGSAKMVAQLQDPSKAAICSKRAAEIYGLEIIKETINHNENNTTRFVVISPKMELRMGRDKICISITAAHESGSLHEVLTIFTVNGLNLVKLESRPIFKRNWEYMFFIEFTGDLTQKGMNDIICQLSQTVYDIKVFGNFKSNLE